MGYWSTQFDIGSPVLINAVTGSEKVTNGSFTGDASGWTLAAGWAYNANAVDKNGDGLGVLEQNVNAVANEVYRVVYVVSNWTVGTVTVSIGGVSGTARGANGTYAEYIVATGTGNLQFTPTNTARLTVDTVSVQRVAVVAADRVTLWVGDRIASGVEQAGDAGLFLRSEDGTINFVGDRWGIGTAQPGDIVNISNLSDNTGLTLSNTAGDSRAALLIADTDAILKSTLNNTGNLLMQTITGGAAAERIRLLNAGAFLINATAAYGRLGQLLEVNASSNYGGQAYNCFSATAAHAPLVEFNRSKHATIGSHTVVADGDALGYILARGSDGDSFETAAGIFFEVDGVPGATDMPGRIILKTSPDGSATLTERVRIDNLGRQHFTQHDAAGSPVAATAALKLFAHNKSVADDAVITLPAVTSNGFGIVVADTASNHFTIFYVDATGTVVLVSNTANVVANADTDTKLCIGTAAPQEPLQIKNRLGAAKVLNVIFWYD